MTTGKVLFDKFVYFVSLYLRLCRRRGQGKILHPQNVCCYKCFPEIDRFVLYDQEHVFCFVPYKRFTADILGCLKSCEIAGENMASFNMNYFYVFIILFFHIIVMWMGLC